MIEHKHFLPPSIVTTRSGRYIVPGWVPCPPNIKLSDIEHIKPEWTKTKSQIYKVTGSKGDIYSVTVTSNLCKCNCPAGQFRGKCKHIEQIKTKISAKKLGIVV